MPEVTFRGLIRLLQAPWSWNLSALSSLLVNLNPLARSPYWLVSVARSDIADDSDHRGCHKFFEKLKHVSFWTCLPRCCRAVPIFIRRFRALAMVTFPALPGPLLSKFIDSS